MHWGTYEYSQDFRSRIGNRFIGCRLFESSISKWSFRIFFLSNRRKNWIICQFYPSLFHLKDFFPMPKVIALKTKLGPKMLKIMVFAQFGDHSLQFNYFALLAVLSCDNLMVVKWMMVVNFIVDGCQKERF